MTALNYQKLSNHKHTHKNEIHYTPSRVNAIDVIERRRMETKKNALKLVQPSAMTFLQYLQQRGKKAYSLTRIEAEMLGIPYPLEKGWVKRYSELEIDGNGWLNLTGARKRNKSKGGRRVATDSEMREIITNLTQELIEAREVIDELKQEINEFYQ